MRKLTALVLALILALAAIPVLGEEDYSGYWYLNMFGVTVGYVEMNADGTMVYAVADDSYDGTWAVSDTGVDLTVEDTTITLTANENGLANEEYVIYLTRESEKINLNQAAIYITTGELPEGVTDQEMTAALRILLGEEEQAGAGETAEKASEERATLSHEEYMAAALEDEVVVYTHVQATQSWWDGKINVYAQSPDGAYFIYNLTCTEEDAAKLVPGTAIVVKGYKAEWSGEIEIADATFVFPDEEYKPFIAEAEDVTALLGTDDLINHQNEFVAFRGMTVEAYDETGAAFAYKNAENKTDDLYFRVSKGGQTYDFCVEFYLCGQDTEVYKAVEALNVGDVIDLEGFLYWYNGANPHITRITKAE